MARGRNLQGGGDSSSDAEAVTIKLRRALEENNLKDVKRILSQYFNPTFPSDDMNGKYNPPTFWAAINGSLNVLIELVENYHCKLNYVTHYGQDLLYIACSRGQNEVVRYLAVHHKFDPRKPNRAGITPMFTACYKGHLETVVLLIEELKCDPFDKTPEGDSLLHTACNNGHLHIVSYLVSKHKLNPESRNQHGETPLHLACSSGHLEVVQYLIDELHCEIIVFDNKELTPLHNACRNGRSNVVSYILSKNGDATLFDNTGNTPLHLACCSGRSDVVKILLDSGNVDPNSISLVKQAPIDITHDSKTIRELIKGGAKPVGRIHDLLQHYKNREPLDSMIHIYVIGFGSAGKTTLIKALQRPVNTKSRFYKYAGIAPSHIQGDIPRTSGIVPIEFHSPDFGRVLMFDFAGQHEYHASHEAILEYSYTSTAPIFLLLINMSEDLMEVKREINYWVSFILRNPVSETSRPHVIIVGSHADQLQKKSPAFRDLVFAIDELAKNKMAKANLFFDGFFALDCRDPFKQDSLRRCLKTICQVLRTDEELDVCCHVLRVFLLDKFSDELFCSIESVISEANVSDYPLPIQADNLCELAEALSTRTKTLFLRNHHQIEKSWIILDIDTLLQKVNGRIFAPESFFEHVLDPSPTGILKTSQLKQCFPTLDTDMLIAFLQQLDFCQIVSDPDVVGNVGHDNDDEIQMDGFKDASQSSCNSSASNVLVPATLPERDPIQNIDKLHSTQLPQSTLGMALQPTTATLAPVKTPNSLYPTSSHYSVSQSHLSIHLEARAGTSHPQYKILKQGHDTLLFFPGLISLTKPEVGLWVLDKRYTFYTGWCLECSNHEHTLGQRFLTTLLLRIMYYITAHTSSPKCTVWKTGIHWLILDGIETIVEMVEDGKAVTLVVRAKKRQELFIETLCIRSTLIREILNTKKHYCSRVPTSEYLIDETHLRTDHGYPVINKPLKELARFDMSLITESFLSYPNGQYVYDTRHKQILPVKELIQFDPYLGLGEETISKIYAEDSQEKYLDPALLLELANCHYDKAELFSLILFKERILVQDKQKSAPSCMEVFLRYKMTGVTLADFREQLDKHSLFASHRNSADERRDSNTLDMYTDVPVQSQSQVQTKIPVSRSHQQPRIVTSYENPSMVVSECPRLVSKSRHGNSPACLELQSSQNPIGKQHHISETADRPQRVHAELIVRHHSPNPPSEVKTNTGPSPFKVFMRCHQRLRKVVSQYYQCAENTTHIPFVDPVTVVVCDHHGLQHTLTDHDITLKIPEGAVPKGKVIHIEMAVALYGPFVFPNNTRPISPILWICPQENIEFCLPIQVILPHCLTNATHQKLGDLEVGFAKADHNIHSGSKEGHDVLFNFKRCTIQPRFSRKGIQGFGCLETMHCCFLCLAAKQCPEIAKEAGFCLSRIDYISKSSTFVVTFCASYFLPSCLKVLNMQFPECVDKHHSHFIFDPRGDGSECLQIGIPCPPQDKYMVNVEPLNRKIKMADVDFWATGCNVDAMKLRHDYELYPPRVIVNWIPVGKQQEYSTLQITVTGCTIDSDLNNDVTLPLVSHSPFISSSTLTTDDSLNSQTMIVLTEREHLKIYQYLQPLEDREIILLGQALGLLRSNLKKMKAFPDDMIDAWLIQSGNVRELSGRPTWMSLCEALRNIGQNGIAGKIEEKEIETEGLTRL